MSGDFDPDKLIEQRRNSTNLFGIIYDPITKQNVRFPDAHAPPERKKTVPIKKQAPKRKKQPAKKKTVTKQKNRKPQKLEIVHRAKKEINAN